MKKVFSKNTPATGPNRYTLSPMGGDEHGCPYVWPGKAPEPASTPISPNQTSQGMKTTKPVRGR